jgi:hypothetical protein
MARVMVRHASDRFDALDMANGMEAAGAEVFSITVDRHSRDLETREPHAQFLVWAKVERDDMIEAVDRAIEAETEERR